MPGSIRFAWVDSGAPKGRRVHSGPLGLTRARQVVDEFIRVRVDSLGCA